MRRALLSAALVTLATTHAHAGGLGRPTVISARAFGFGGAFTPIADDPSALHYNPAGLALQSKNAILFSVGRDDLYRRVEQRFEVEGKEPKKGAIVMEFSELNAAKCRLPDEVKKKLKIE